MKRFHLLIRRTGKAARQRLTDSLGSMARHTLLLSAGRNDLFPFAQHGHYLLWEMNGSKLAAREGTEIKLSIYCYRGVNISAEWRTLGKSVRSKGFG